jgi:acyl carrier protein
MSTLVALKQVLADLRVDPALAHALADDASVLTDVGLDSLELLRFMLEIESRLAVEIDFERLDYCHLDSLASLAAHLDGVRRSDAAVSHP